MVVVRMGAVNRVSQQRSELDVRQRTRGPHRGQWGSQVVRRRIEAQSTSTQFAEVGETAAIPPDRLAVVKVEVMNLLLHRSPDVRVLDEIVKEGRRAAPLRANDQGGRPSPGRRREIAIPVTHGAHWPYGASKDGACW